MAAAEVEESPVVGLSNQYRNEFNELRQRTQAISDSFIAKAQVYQDQLRELQPAVNKEELIATLQDQSELTGVDRSRMLSTFTWTGVMLAAMTASCVVSRFLLAPVLSFAISEMYASLAAYVVVPFVAFRYFTGPVEGDAQEMDKFRRHSLLAVAVMEGILKGVLYSEHSLPGMAPPSFVVPACIGMMSALAAPQIGNDRVKLIGVTMGTGMAIHGAIGVLTGFSAGFVALTLAYTAVGFGFLQMYLKYGDGDNKSHAYQAAYMVAVVYSQAVVFSLFAFNDAEASAAA